MTQRTGRRHLLSRRRALALLGGSAVVPFAGCNTSGTPSSAATTAAVHGEALEFMTLRDVARRISAREVSPADLTQRTLDRIAALDPTLKSYATVMHDQALADA